MRSYFAGSVQPTFPLRAALRPQRPSAPDFVCDQLCKSDSNAGEGGAFLLLNVELTLQSSERFAREKGCLLNPPASISTQQDLSAERPIRSEHLRWLGFLRASRRD